MFPYLVGFLRLATGVFFRSIEVTGKEHVPAHGGGILVAWHPNGIIDGLLILCYCPRPVVFGARHGLFQVPLLGWLLRSLGTVRLFRAQDESGHNSREERQAANRRSLESMARAATRSFAAIFPEGATHDESHLLELRTGAARLHYLTARISGDTPPALVPVGLHYDKKHAFRSRVLVSFHPPIALPTELQTGEEASREQVDGLTALIDRTLHEVVHATESWQLNHIMGRIRKIVRAERAARFGVGLGRSDMEERQLGFARVWVGYHARMASHPKETQRLMSRVRRYDEAMNLLRLQDRDLDSKSHRSLTRRLLLVVAEATVVFLLLPPLVLFGYIINLPTALLLKALSHQLSTTRKEQAGIKVLTGAVAFPLTWLAVSLVVGWARPSFWTQVSWTPQTPALAALAALVVCAASGALALRYHRLAGQLGRALRTLFTRSRRFDAIGRMRERRSRLHDTIMDLAEGLDLPHAVQPDGRIAANDE